ncbi:MAG TPA: BON domain-containing protein, partial [Burkholderiaceae bacterium]
YQRNAAATAVRPLKGVIGVTNAITIKPRAVASDIGTRIGAALSRHAWREANAIQVGVKGSTVTLRGRIDSLAERNAAEGAAWSAPGVTTVVSELTIG